MTLQKYANIDMNDFVSIKPTEAGWRQIVADVDRRNDNIRRNPECLYRISVPKADADGYISGQFWALMKSFDWEDCDPGGDMPFSDLRITISPEPQQEAAVSDKMTHPEELSELIRMAQCPVQFLSNPSTIASVKRAQYAVNEIRRLRAKNNRLIRVHNEQDADGNHIGEHYAATEDLVLEEEI